VPTPSDTPTPACSPVTGPFAGIWQAKKAQLGCAQGGAFTTFAAQERFERGHMFWRQDTDRIYALYGHGVWQSYDDIWVEGDSTFSCPDIAPSQSPPTPARGFGKIWCAQDNVRNGLGNAVNAEHGFNAQVQVFDNATLLLSDGGSTYVFWDDGSWTRE
jgi:hypothetical protein